jgi:hypothetical protein
MTYRILSLDGGGTWALIQVKALIALYGAGAPGHKVLEQFDLAAANSGGSMVLGGLLENLTLGELLSFFLDESKRKSVFSPSHSLGDKLLRSLLRVGPKYSEVSKLPALQSAFPRRGNLSLAQAAAGLRRTGAAEDLRVLILAFDYDRDRAKFFRSSPASGPEWGAGSVADVTVVEAIHASSNAPVNYFDKPAVFPDRAGRYWDGALAGCNNPVLAAVTEAIGARQKPLDIVALSLGAGLVALPWRQPGEPASPFLQPVVDPAFTTDLLKLATSLLDDPPDTATFLAHVMTGSGAGLNQPAADSRIVRMNPLIAPVKGPGGWCAPGTMTLDEFTFLRKLDIDAIERPQVDAITGYADLWLQGVARNQPIRMNGDTLERELGQDTFPKAAAAWQAIS